MGHYVKEECKKMGIRGVDGANDEKRKSQREKTAVETIDRDKGRQGRGQRRVMMVHMCTERRRWGMQTQVPHLPDPYPGHARGGYGNCMDTGRQRG